MKLHSDGQNAISHYLCYVEKNLTCLRYVDKNSNPHHKKQSLGQAFSKACGVLGQSPERRPDSRSAERETLCASAERRRSEFECRKATLKERDPRGDYNRFGVPLRHLLPAAKCVRAACSEGAGGCATTASVDITSDAPFIAPQRQISPHPNLPSRLRLLP